MAKLPYKDILDTRQFSRSDLELIFETARDMERILTWEKPGRLLDGKILATLFYESSPRTRISFESAMKRLGGEVISVSDEDGNSLAEGESLADNAKITSLYADIIVMRHSEAGSVAASAQSTTIPVINAGDGNNEHPTQALLDVYTILKERGTLDNLHISLVGDLKHGRSAHSLVLLMALFEGISFSFISPSSLQMPKKVLEFLDERGISYFQTENLKEGMTNSSVLYVTRLEERRCESKKELEHLKKNFTLKKSLLEYANEDMTILHPLPRSGELEHDIDSLPNAAFFRQAANGVPIRMALLYLLLGAE